MNELMARQQYQRTAIAAGVGAFLIGLGSPVFAQEAVEPQTVVVTGVRAALEQSLRQKRDSDALSRPKTSARCPIKTWPTPSPACPA